MDAEEKKLLVAMADQMHLAFYGAEALQWDDLEELERECWLRVATLVNSTMSSITEARAAGVDVELIAAALADPLVGQIVRGILLRNGYRMTIVAVDNHPEAKRPIIQ